MKNIILVGMPGSGKSTAGVLLSKALGSNFTDTDLIIQRKEGLLLHEIIEQRGIEGFLKIEDEVLFSLCVESSVIATGGSAVLSNRGMAHLKENGFVIFIDLEPDLIEKRICDIQTRGVVMAKGETIRNIYDYRLPYYQKYADVTVKVLEKTSVEELVKTLFYKVKGLLNG